MRSRIEIAAVVTLALATVALFFIGIVELRAEHSRATAEEARAVNLALSRLEQAVDNHRDSGPCLRYVTKAGLGEKIARGEWIEDFPTDPPDDPHVRQLCLGALLIQFQETDVNQIPVAAQVSYIRREIYSVLNALEEASTFNAVQNHDKDSTQEDDDKHSGAGEDEDRQRELRRQIRSIAGPPHGVVSEMIKIDNEIANKNRTIKRNIENLSHVCRIINCE